MNKSIGTRSKEQNAYSHLNKFKFFISTILIGLASLTSGCAYTLCDRCEAERYANSLQRHSTLQQQPSNPPSIRDFSQKEVKITAVGYGASSSHEGYTPGQKRLMAMRSSKLDAYRALAEQVQGVRVNGNSTVSAMMAQVDSFRVLVDAYLRGAKVVTVTPMNEGNYETTMELTLDSRFFYAFSQYENVSAPEVVGANVKGAIGSSAVHGSHFYYSE